MPRGRFIVLEGLDGAGTTTQTGVVARSLSALGFSVVTTREPSDGPFGRILRGAVEGEAKFAPELLALGFAADRLSHVDAPGGIRELVGSGAWVVSDRYVLSSLAYQAALGVDLEWLLEINRHAMAPDVTVFVDTPVSSCLGRISSRGTNREDLFHRRAVLYSVRKEYVKAVSRGVHVGRLVTVDGKGTVDEVGRRIMQGLLEKLGGEFGLFAPLVLAGVEELRD